MGVTVSKNEETRTSKPLQDFKKVSTRVGKIGVLARQARLKSETKNEESIHKDSSVSNGHQVDAYLKPREELTPYRRPSVAQFYDGDDTGHTLVYKDTSDAWAALRAGTVVDNIEEIPETEISVVESTLGGYKTVEKTRGAMGSHHFTSDGEFDSGTDSTYLGSVREQSLSSTRDDDFTIPFSDGVEPKGWKEKIESQEKCTLCETNSGHEVFPCRICTLVFHEHCMRRKGQLHDSEAVKALRQANTNIGWSCNECENLGQLLSDDEMFELMEIFERCDVDSDATISLEEFIEYRRLVIKDHENRDLTKDEVEDETRNFKSMDTDRTGTLSWWEFLNHEAIRRLATRSKKKLVQLLKPKEIQTLRTNFLVFDTDGDGCVTEYEARRAFKNWFSKFIEDPYEMSPDAQRRLGSQTSLRMSSELASHVNTNTGMLMGADSDRSGSVSWEEYVMEQALYTLAVRPNIGPVKISRRPTFCSF
ncbi:PHD finger protein 24-like [Lytechinus variegatus]|uniref:PHD finger protein 24-like n=1 Tax=Lytechinus variegatus TaxID=7654 RepID=UPI001BB0E424|nr:PHD finger protein 24-like [Lytechinus variegatus]